MTWNNVGGSLICWKKEKKKRKMKKASFNGREVAMLLVLLYLGIGRALLCYEVLLPANFFGHFIPECLCVSVNYLVLDYDQEERS